jgi:hypothetical protein
MLLLFRYNLFNQICLRPSVTCILSNMIFLTFASVLPTADEYFVKEGEEKYLSVAYIRFQNFT